MNKKFLNQNISKKNLPSTVLFYDLNAPYIISQEGCPLIMDNRTLHSAQFLEPKDMTQNQTAVPRLFIRIIVRAPSRMHLVPLKSTISISQIYTPVVVM